MHFEFANSFKTLIGKNNLFKLIGIHQMRPWKVGLREITLLREMLNRRFEVNEVRYLQFKSLSL